MPGIKKFLGFRPQDADKPTLSVHQKEQWSATTMIQRMWRQKHYHEEEKREWVLLPVLIIPGIASSGLFIEETGLPHPEKYVGRRAWMDVAFLAAERMASQMVNEEEIKKAESHRSSLQEEDFTLAETALQVRSAWLHHMSLDSNMIDERPGNKVRVYKGLEGIEYLSDDTMTQIGSWVHAPVTTYLVEELGYTKGKNLDGAPYDWRIPPAHTEARDGYLTKTMIRVEEMYEANGNLPVVLVCHSMGCKMGHYFLNFCLEEKGQAWIDKYIHTYMPVGAPHCGVSLAVRSGVTGKGLNDQVDMLLEGDDEGLVLYRSWGSGAWLMPRYLPPRTIPSCIVRKEGELAIKIASVIQVGPLFAHREKPPKSLRLTVIFRGNLRAHTAFVPVMINATEDVTVMFNETFYIAVPYLGESDHLGALHFYLEEPGGRIDQNPGKLRQKLRAMTSWAPVKAAKKAMAKKIREVCQKWGTVLRVAVCSDPWRLLASKFTPAIEDADGLLEREILMCGCAGNDDSNPLDTAKRTVAYNDDTYDEDPENLDPTDLLRSGVMKATDKELAPRLDQPIGTLLVKVKYTPPPSPNTERGQTTPVAATTPGKTPIVPIIDRDANRPLGQPEPIFETWNGHDLLEHDGFCGPIWNLLEKYYEGDPLGPTNRSALYAPPVRRVRAIYGVNLDTEVCAVYRHRPVVVVGDDMADSRYVLDTSAAFPDDDDILVKNNPWAEHNLNDYKMVHGRIFETSKTLQDVPGKKEQRRVCGDGTVPYWNLVQCLNWKDEVPDLSIDELKGAEHRGILSDVRFHSLLKTYCRVRDPRASAMLHMHQQNTRTSRMSGGGAGGIGSLKAALEDS